MIETGTVLEWRDGRVRVRLDGASEGKCPGCSMASHCAGESAGGIIDVPAEAEIAPGTCVNVYMKLPSAAKAAVVVFLLPLVALLAGFLLARALGESFFGPGKGEGAGILGALALVALTFLTIAVVERRRARTNPQIRIQLLDDNPPE